MVSSLTARSRLLKHAVESHKPVLLLNVGPTRGDNVAGVEKIDISSGLVMREVARAVMSVIFF
jgi:NAD+-dependent protein deacetylase sirtuin 4